MTNPTLILPSEEAERWQRKVVGAREVHYAETIGRVGPKPDSAQLTLVWLPSEQPKGEAGYFYWQGKAYRYTDLLAALVRYWWQEINGNEGEPPIGISGRSSRQEGGWLGRGERCNTPPWGSGPASLGGSSVLPDPLPVRLMRPLTTNERNVPLYWTAQARGMPIGPALLLRAWGEQTNMDPQTLGQASLPSLFLVRYELREANDV